MSGELIDVIQQKEFLFIYLFISIPNSIEFGNVPDSQQLT